MLNLRCSLRQSHDEAKLSRSKSALGTSYTKAQPVGTNLTERGCILVERDKVLTLGSSTATGVQERGSREVSKSPHFLSSPSSLDLYTIFFSWPFFQVRLLRELACPASIGNVLTPSPPVSCIPAVRAPYAASPRTFSLYDVSISRFRGPVLGA